MAQPTVFDTATQSAYEKRANQLLRFSHELKGEYWEKSAELSQTEYYTTQEQMRDAQQLGQLAEVVSLLQSAQAKLRCINGVNVK